MIPNSIARLVTCVLPVAILAIAACGDEPTQPTDTTAPTVFQRTPAPGATNVAAGSVVTVTFSEPMNAATITGATFTLSAPGGGNIAGSVTATGPTATFTPAAPLAEQRVYTAQIWTGVTDVAGNGLSANHSWTFKIAPVAKIIGDIEGPIGSFCSAPGSTTLPTANSINVGSVGLASAQADTFPNLQTIAGGATAISFAFDAGGGGFGVVFCGQPGNADEADGITENGPVLHKPWHIAGLAPGGTYTMTFTGGGYGALRRSIRIFADADGDGTIEAGEVQDLIGLNGVVETRTFGPLTASATGVIKGEYWGGSTNGTGENGAWRGWSIIGSP